MDIHELQAAEPEALKPIYPQLNFVYIDHFLDAWIQDISADQALGGPIPTESWGAWAHRILEDKESDVHTKIYLLAVLRYYESFPLATVDTLVELRDDLSVLKADVARASGDPSKLPDRFRTFLQPAATLAACHQVAKLGGPNLIDEVRALDKANVPLTDIPNKNLSKTIAAVLKRPLFGINAADGHRLYEIRKKALRLLRDWGIEFNDDPNEADPYGDHPLLHRPSPNPDAAKVRSKKSPSVLPHIVVGLVGEIARAVGKAIWDQIPRRRKRKN